MERLKNLHQCDAARLLVLIIHVSLCYFLCLTNIYLHPHHAIYARLGITLSDCIKMQIPT